ncbi:MULTISPECIES: hypothetical protein [unclassified Streptomyces]|uniref:hypothetical protein n=1 Tax=unclassified Streptomyces TaxID=2593676 RepID=UPI0033F9828B
MRHVLVWLVRLSALGAWGAAAVACWQLLGSGPVPRPYREPLVWGAVAVGCAVVRVVALWTLRAPAAAAWWRRYLSAGVPLTKAPHAWSDPRSLSFDDSVLWVKLRTAAVWLLVAFSAGAFFAAMMTSPDWGERADALRDAGAEVSTATVVARPGDVREEFSDGDLEGYTSHLVVSVPGGPERLAVPDAFTYDKPVEGAEVDVLWARAGGYADERKHLPTIAAGRWAVFPDDENGGAALVAFVVLAVIGGAVLTPFFTIGAHADRLQRLAWSPLAQTVRTGLAVGVFLGWRPLLLGREPAPTEMAFAGGGFLLVLAVYIGTSMRTLR